MLGREIDKRCFRDSRKPNYFKDRARMNIIPDQLFSGITWEDFVKSIQIRIEDFIDPSGNNEPIILDDEFIDKGTKSILKLSHLFEVPKINLESKVLNPDGSYSYQFNGNPRFFRNKLNGWAYEPFMGDVSYKYSFLSQQDSGTYSGALFSITGKEKSQEEIEKCVRKISDVLAHLKKDVDELLSDIPNMVRDTALAYQTKIDPRNRS